MARVGQACTRGRDTLVRPFACPPFGRTKILNRRTWLGAGALGVFTALATVLAHQFWTLDGIERVRELNTFLEHEAIIAGLVLVAILGVAGASDARVARFPQ
jgi:hypothetical protein